MSPKIHNAKNYQGMKVVLPMTLYYETFINHPGPSRYWAILFKDSVTVHFHRSSSGAKNNVKSFREGEEVTGFNFLTAMKTKMTQFAFNPSYHIMVYIYM